MSNDNSMRIKVTNNSISSDGVVDMRFDIVGRRPISKLNEVYFLTVLYGLQDTDSKAFMNALESFFKSELEQDNDEE